MRFTREDIKISFDKPVYYVNEEKKTVVCVLDYQALIPQATFIPSKTPESDEYSLFEHVSFGNVGFLSFSGSVKTKAKCHVDDVFDSEIGCDIAFARAENAAYTEVLNVVREYASSLTEFLNKVDNFADKTISHNEHNSEYIAELSEKSLKVKE